MAVAILAVHEPVIVHEVTVASVVGRVDVDDIDLGSVGIAEHGEGVQVVALDEGVLGGAGFGSLQPAGGHLFQHGQKLAQGFFYGFGLVFPHQAVTALLVEQLHEGGPVGIGKIGVGQQAGAQVSGRSRNGRHGKTGAKGKKVAEGGPGPLLPLQRN